MGEKHFCVTQYGRRYRRALLTLVMLLTVLLGEAVSHFIWGSLSSQQLAARWSKDASYAQVSAFFGQDAGVQETQMTPLAVQIESALADAAVETQTDAARTYMLAYSAAGTLSITGTKNSITADAYGVSEDFFSFHPLTLVSGSLLFAGGDDEADTLVLDENGAWQLFGATDVAGMTVEIDGTAYVVSGVVKSDTGIFSEEAGAEEVTVYVPYRILKQQDENLTVENLELLIADPVSQFGADTLESALQSVFGLSEEQYLLVENSARYSLAGRFQMLREFGRRSMQKNGIIYPYWENQAVAAEDITALLLAAEMLCLCYPLFRLMCLIRYLWKRKKAAAGWLKEHMMALVYQIRFKKIKKAENA